MQKIIITGVSRGLGEALFELFATKNYFVYGVVRREDTGNTLQKKYPDNTQIIVADLSRDDAIVSIQEAVQKEPIDLLINNAGVAGKAFSIRDTNTQEILNLFNIHCLGVLRTTKALTDNLLLAEQPVILNINSRFGSITRQANGTYRELGISYSYRIAKAAQNMLTNCLRIEFKDQLEVVSLHPGKMKTAIAQTDADLDPQEVAQRILRCYENGQLKAANGIVALEKEIIEW